MGVGPALPHPGVGEVGEVGDPVVDVPSPPPASRIGWGRGRRSGCGEVSQACSLAGAGGSRSPGDAEEQLQRLREERTCKVCLDHAVSVVFVPCGHLVCAACAPNLQLCPICRAAIRSCVRTFLS